MPDQDLSAALAELAYGCRILYMEGHADMTLGHLSLRDPDGRGVWLKRSGIGLGEVQPEDFILIDFSGNRLFGDGRLHKEWPIHTEIMRRRPDVMVAGHSHPFHATAFSALDVELSAVTNEAVYLGVAPARFSKTTGLIDTPTLGENLADALGGASTVLMRNHGISFVGPDIASATMMGLFLERACRSQLTLLSTGLAYATTAPEDISRKHDEIFDPGLIKTFWAFFKRRADRAQHVH
jgi:ribulose-5-phosphate 4-epimerase/fuculose-1-phosphate aldolase